MMRSKKHLFAFRYRLGCGYSRWISGAWWRVVAVGVHRRRHGCCLVEHLGVWTAADHWRTNGREGELLLERSGGIDDGVIIEIECVETERQLGVLCLRLVWLRRIRRVQGIVVQCSVGRCILRHNVGDWRYLRRRFCTPLRRLRSVSGANTGTAAQSYPPLVDTRFSHVALHVVEVLTTFMVIRRHGRCGCS